MDLSNKIKTAAEYIKGKSKYNPTIGLILGSGLGAIADQIEGHAGRLVIGKFQGKEVVAMQGRFHYYEGYSMQEVTCPVRVMRLLGVETLVVTNAAGAVNKDYTPGDLMIISDHLNLSGSNPLIGKNLSEFGTRFPDMSNAYDKELRSQVKDIAKNLGIEVREGVYAMFSGPTYETPAEVRMARILGADAVGMSTVPEVIVAAHSGLKVLGISCITNHAAGFQEELNHEEVVEVTERVKGDFKGLVKAILAEL